MMLAVLFEMNFLVLSFRVPVNNHAANRAPEAKPSPIANVLDLLILLINLIFCLNVTLLAKICFATGNFRKHITYALLEYNLYKASPFIFRNCR